MAGNFFKKVSFLVLRKMSAWRNFAFAGQDGQRAKFFGFLLNERCLKKSNCPLRCAYLFFERGNRIALMLLCLSGAPLSKIQRLHEICTTKSNLCALQRGRLHPKFHLGVDKFVFDVFAEESFPKKKRLRFRFRRPHKSLQRKKRSETDRFSFWHFFFFWTSRPLSIHVPVPYLEDPVEVSSIHTCIFTSDPVIFVAV